MTTNVKTHMEARRSLQGLYGDLVTNLGKLTLEADRLVSIEKEKSDLLRATAHRLEDEVTLLRARVAELELKLEAVQTPFSKAFKEASVAFSDDEPTNPGTPKAKEGVLTKEQIEVVNTEEKKSLMRFFGGAR